MKKEFYFNGLCFIFTELVWYISIKVEICDFSCNHYWSDNS